MTECDVALVSTSIGVGSLETVSTCIVLSYLELGDDFCGVRREFAQQVWFGSAILQTALLTLIL